jgi:pimeloyl-ACP methyl ester carboxylesterase
MGKAGISGTAVTRRAARVGCVLWAALAGGCGGSDGGGTEPPASATLSGIVRAEGSQAPIAGAEVRAGTVTAITGADGQFTLSNLPVSQTVTVEARAERFQPRTQQLLVQAGSTQLEIVLSARTLYDHGDLVARIDPAAARYRGVLLLVPGSGGDIRPMVRGETGSICREYCGRYEEVLGALQVLARKYDLALLGANTLDTDPAPHLQVLESIASIGTQSAHPELAEAPILVFGHSLGGCYAYSLARQHAARVIGFISGKGGCHVPADAGTGGRGVPGYLFIGERDMAGRAENINGVFEENRARGAVWAVATEPNAEHEPIRDIGLQIRWMDAVLALRLPATPGEGLRPVNAAAGWLADRTTYVIAPAAAFSGDAAKASWLPTEQAAQDWKQLVEKKSEQ